MLQTEQVNQMRMQNQVQGEFFAFKENVDCWIKDFNGQVQKMETLTGSVDELMNNSNHNYELIQGMRRQVEELQQEVKTIKLMQLLTIKRSLQERKLE